MGQICGVKDTVVCLQTDSARSLQAEPHIADVPPRINAPGQQMVFCRMGNVQNLPEVGVAEFCGRGFCVVSVQIVFDHAKVFP